MYKFTFIYLAVYWISAELRLFGVCCSDRYLDFLLVGKLTWLPSWRQRAALQGPQGMTKNGC